MTPGPMICRTSGETWCKCGCFAEGKPYAGDNFDVVYVDEASHVTALERQPSNTELAKRMANYPANRAGRRAFWKAEEKARRAVKR